MNKFILIVDQNKYLYELLIEIKLDLQYKLLFLDNNINDEINKIINNQNDYLIITDNPLNKFKKNKTLVLSKPMKISQLYEKINVINLKNKYSNNSNISIGKYTINLNSRNISRENSSLKLTEKELEMIMYLFDSKDEKKSNIISKDVWGYSENVETHTVETHIYRLRKKIIDKFKDNNFIISNDKGYKIL
mgnify:CR=1 FL=1